MAWLPVGLCGRLMIKEMMSYCSFYFIFYCQTSQILRSNSKVLVCSVSTVR